MAREKGTFNFSANLEVKKQGPLDARQTMITYEELIQAATWQDESGKMYLFNGLIVPVTNGSDKQLYMLIDASKYNEPAYWKRIDAGAAVSEKEVYMIPGNPTSLNGESSAEDIKDVYGDLNTLKQAVADNKIITANVGGAIHLISIGIEDATITSLIYYSLGVMVQTITTAESDYVSIEVSGKQIPDASEFVQDVTAETDKGIEVTGTKENKKVGVKIDETTKGNVKLSLGANGLKADFEESVKGVKAGDKVLKVESDKTLSSTLNLNYDSESKKIQLLGIGSEVIAEIDATAFIKDGMINAVELVTNPEEQSPGTYIKITFNTDAGKEPIFLDVTGLIDVYVAGNGISVSGKTISVKIDSSTEKYLSLGTAGLKLAGVNQAIADAISEAFSWHDA